MEKAKTLSASSVAVAAPREWAEPSAEVAPPQLVVKEQPRPKSGLAEKGLAWQETFDFGQGSAKSFQLPPVGLLAPPPASQRSRTREELEANAAVLKKKLQDFGVDGHIVQASPGPVITSYEFEPAPGVKVNRIVTRADDLSMALRALSVRVLAPIPGKPVVGIEVSNPRREKVFIRDLVQTDDFQRAESNIALALGKDTTGNVLVADLARMPHLLVAGTTGSGKSVGINAMILSLLYKADPSQVRMILIDPKMLELSVYEGIAHLLCPVVTDMRSPPIGNASWRPFRRTPSEQFPIEIYGEVNCSFTHSMVFSASEQIRKTSCTVFGPT
jgi:S-DNA-T family DNA segregation ATPase FtsK/SpoIIIE